MSTLSFDLLQNAVHHHPPFKLKGVEERMFTKWFGAFFYNQIWEDPRVDLEALEPTPDTHILTIASGGCNVLNYLITSPASITAVDLNPCHIYLTRLKLAALEHLPTYEDFFRFFGSADHPENLDNYYRYLRDELDDATRNFWEGGSWLRQRTIGPRINYFSKNLYNYARLGYFIRFLHILCKITRCNPSTLLSAKTPEEQTRLFEENIEHFFDHWLVKASGRLPFLLFGLGVPPQQIKAMNLQTPEQLLNMVHERVKRLACAHPLSDNYFSWQAFSRGYDKAQRRAVPDYLKEENYQIIKNNVSRVTTHITNLHNFLQAQQDDSLDCFVFLDSQDWMKPEGITELWEDIARVGRPGTKIIFRTASHASPIEAALPQNLSKRFYYEKERSLELFAKDRSAIYGGFHLYVMPE